MLNVVLVVIDAMRADALTPAVAPNTFDLAQDAIRFDGNFSGGNSSRAGMFSLFYGLPGTYWDAFASLTRPPLVMDLFQRYGYQLGLFSSVPVYRAAALDRTALARVPNLRLETVSRYPGSNGWDRTLTDEWFEWLDRRDPAHPFSGSSTTTRPRPSRRPPMTPRWCPSPRSAEAGALECPLPYGRTLRRLLGRPGDRRPEAPEAVRPDRDHRHLRSRHGVQRERAGLHRSRHGLQRPPAPHTSGRALARAAPGRVDRRTSHNDVAPTLITELFGCANPPSDYSSGHSLFSDAQWDWLIAAGYEDFALIEPDRVTVVLPSSYEIRDRNYRLVPKPTLPAMSFRPR